MRRTLWTRDRRAALLLTLGVLIWSLIPLAWLLADVVRHGGVLSGAEGMLAGSDQHLYMHWIRESGSDVLISNEYRLGTSDGVFFHPMFAISGLLHALGLDIRATLWLWKPVAVVALAAGTWAFVGLYLQQRARLAGAVLALFYFSPVLPLLVWGGADLDFFDEFALTLVSGESMPALQLWGYLHSALVVGLMGLVLVGVVRLLEGRARGEPAGRRLLVLTSLGSMAVGWIHPWQGATLLAVYIGMALWGRLGAHYRVLAIPTLATGLPMTYLLLVSKLNRDWEIDAIQNTAPHAAFWILASGLALIAIPALAGLRLREPSDRERILVLWAVAALAAYFAASQFPYHALQGLTVPLAVLAVRGWSRLRLPAIAGAAALALVTIPGAVHVVDTFRDNKRSTEAPYILEPGEAAALRHIESEPDTGGVLARYYIGMTVPSLAGRDTWVGQFTWSPDFDERRATAEELFGGRMPPAEAQRLVRDLRPAFVLADCGVSTDLRPILGPTVGEARRFGCATVYPVVTR